METDFWLQRWQNDEIGFHQDSIHPCLIEYFSSLHLARNARIFVPLCGKSRDMLWLVEQGYRVCGVELSEKAILAFFAENQLRYQKQSIEGFQLYQSADIDLFCGDFFRLTKPQIAHCDAVFDRASLIALPADMRLDYVKQLQSLFPAGLNTLLITLAYDPAEMQGPPHSVARAEIGSLYGADYEITECQAENIIEAEPHFKEKGLSALTESVYRLIPKAHPDSQH